MLMPAWLCFCGDWIHTGAPAAALAWALLAVLVEDCKDGSTCLETSALHAEISIAVATSNKGEESDMEEVKFIAASFTG
jgi:hypothetical protein